MLLLKQLRYVTADMEALAETFTIQKVKEEKPRSVNPTRRRGKNKNKKQKLENLEDLSN